MYHRVFVAGTFDGIHKGHEAILAAACNAGEAVTIGLTSDKFIKMYKIPASPAGRHDSLFMIQSFELRKQRLFEWIAKNGFEDRVTITPIDDPYEPAASDPEINALVVSAQTKARGEEINAIRIKNSLAPLDLIVVPMVDAQDRKPISAERIRTGEIDGRGRLILPDALRPELAQPFGKVLVGDAIGTAIEAHRNDIVITVGDITTKIFLTAGVTPSLSIVDFLVERKPFPELDGRFAAMNIFRVNVASGPGFIAREAVSVIKKWSLHPEEKIVLAVSGEEDLLALPAIAYGPPGAVVYYGQPGKGAVEVLITPEKRQEAASLLHKFI